MVWSLVLRQGAAALALLVGKHESATGVVVVADGARMLLVHEFRMPWNS